MEKLCTLKSVVPGSIVEVPSAYSRSKGELAVLIGPRYENSESHNITASLLRSSGETFFTPPIKEIEVLKLVEDEKLKKALVASFVEHKFHLPVMGMSCGCDPEIFVMHGDGSLFPAWEFMPDEDTAREVAKGWLSATWVQNRTVYEGKAWNDTNSLFNAQRCPAYWDGAQAEFAPYAKNCLETLHYGTRSGLQAVLDFARLKDKAAKLSLRSVVELPDEVLKNAENKYIQFRCSQSYNIYGDCGDGIPDARTYKYRCAGGHIHIGYTIRPTASSIEQIVRALDGILGVAGVSLAAGFDNPERRHTYGRAGEFRLPEHGLEYRVLSNFWLGHPAITMLVFELARTAVRMGESGLFNLCWDATEKETRQVINECDVQGARDILTRNLPVLRAMFNEIWGQYLDKPVEEQMRATAIHTLLNGTGVAVQNLADVEGNWRLGGEFKYYCRDDNASWYSLSKSIKM